MLDTNEQFSTDNHMMEAIMSTRWIFRSLAGLLLTVAVPAAMAQAQLTVTLSNVCKKRAMRGRRAIALTTPQFMDAAITMHRGNIRTHYAP